ncbi:MAG: WD40 repeat domain-containing protein [Pirellulales bacterium]
MSQDRGKTLEEVVDEFLERARQGEAPSIDAYVLDHPQMAASLLAVALSISTLAVVATTAAFREAHLRRQSERRQDAIQRNLYFAQMNLAGQAADEPGGIATVRELTGRWRPELAKVDLRGWEWYYLRSLGQRERFTLRGHSECAWGVRWNADGSQVVSAANDGTLRIWEATTGKEVLTFEGHRSPIYTVDWNPTGTQVASGDRRGVVIVWDAGTGRTLHRLTGHTSQINCVRWSPDGSQVASTSNDKSVILWDAKSGEQAGRLATNTGGVLSVDWNMHDAYPRLATAGDNGTVKIWDLATGDLALTLGGHIGPVAAVGWSNNGKQLVTAGWDGMLRIWDASPAYKKGG